jgi:hypothetical protein
MGQCKSTDAFQRSFARKGIFEMFSLYVLIFSYCTIWLGWVLLSGVNSIHFDPFP